MPDLWMDVDAALAEVPVNIAPLIDDTDFKTVEDAVAYNASGMDLRWNFVTTAGAFTSTAVTPTTAGTYDWAHQGDGMYSIEIPATGGASINNDTEGFGWFTGKITGVLPFRGPIIGFRAAGLNNALIDGTTIDVNVTKVGGNSVPVVTADLISDAVTPTVIGGRIDANVGAVSGDATAADNLEALFDGTGYNGGGGTRLIVDANAVGGSEFDFSVGGPIPALGVLEHGTAQSVGASSVVLRASSAFGNDTLIGNVIMVYGSDQGYWQSRVIDDSVLSTDTVTISTAWAVTPTGSNLFYIILAQRPGTVSGTVSANVIQWSGTAVGTPHTAGYPVVTVKDGTGTGEINTLAGSIEQVNLVGEVAADGINTSTISTTAKAGIAAAVKDVALTAPTGAPDWTGTVTLGQGLAWLSSLGINKVIHNRSTGELEAYNAAGTKIAEAPFADSGGASGSATREKWGAID